MTLRPCLDCGEPADGSYCHEHQPTYQRGEQPNRPSAHRLGYDKKWQQLSRRARQLQPWCADCGTSSDLTADHLRWPATKLAHVDVVCRACNSRRGPIRSATPRGSTRDRGVGRSASGRPRDSYFGPTERRRTA